MALSHGIMTFTLILSVAPAQTTYFKLFGHLFYLHFSQVSSCQHKSNKKDISYQEKTGVTSAIQIRPKWKLVAMWITSKLNSIVHCLTSDQISPAS